MISPPKQSNFAELFKEYRLKSQIETLTEFGDLLAEEGYIYENSLFTRWQNGQRVPKDRRLLLVIIDIFVKRGGIKEEIEADTFMESANQRDLTEEERTRISNNFYLRKQPLPNEIDIFVGREQIIKDTVWHLINKKKVILYGPPGIGKTAMGIRIVHLLKDQFPDGVFWFRADLKSENDIIDELLVYLGYDVKSLNSIELKLAKLPSITEKKHFLILLDNIDYKQASSLIVKQLAQLKVSVLFTAIQPFLQEPEIIKTKIQTFTSEEFFCLASNILGNPFIIQNKDDLNSIGNLIDYLPISSAIILKQISINPLKIKSYITELKKFDIRLNKFHYDNKTLFSSLEISYTNLSPVEKQILLSCSIFYGSDFSIEALSHINDLSQSFIKNIIERLVSLSLIEFSVKNRFRLHPMVKIFLKSKVNPDKNLSKARDYYIYNTQKTGKNGENFFNQEIENIIGIMEVFFELKYYKEFIDIWSAIKTHLWYLGKWNYIILLKKKIQKSFLSMNDQFGLAIFLSEDLCRIYFYINKKKQEWIYLKKALKIALELENDVVIGLVEQKYGFNYLAEGKLQMAKEKLQKSITLLKQDGPKRDLLKSYIYLGKTFMHLGDYNSGLKELKRALKESMRHNIVEDIGLSHIFLGDLYSKMKSYSEAQKHFEKGLDIEKNIKRKIVIAIGYEGLGEVKENLGLKLPGLSYYKNALKLYTSLNMKKEAAIVYKRIMQLN